MSSQKQLPDVASNAKVERAATLRWVGMEAIAIPLFVRAQGALLQVSASADLYVSLDAAEAKGIHMSRLHLALNRDLGNQTLTLETLQALLSQMQRSQEGISKNAKLALSFDLVLSKPAMLSGEQGFQRYPIRIESVLRDNEFSTQVDVEVPYSSTCPCSASLSRQLYSEAFDQRFGEESIPKDQILQWILQEAGSVATPHSQRSYAYIKLTLAPNEWFEFDELIFDVEKAIGTPVQTAVKRQDEQAFAKLNADNLMFCEDAARRLKDSLEHMNGVVDYWFKVEHQESLHAHNAVAIDYKFSE